jgi:putative inorganic carbon (HCO3(-)) transporter
MAAQLDLSRWVVPPLLALLAVVVGLLAGAEPRLAIAAALACGFVVLAFANLAAGVATFAFISFIEIVPLGSSVVSFTKLAGLLLALSWFAAITTRSRPEQELPVVHPLVSAALVLFLGWALLSSVWSEQPSDAVASAGRYALNAAMLLIVFTAVQTRRQLGWVMFGFVAGAAVAALYGILSPQEELQGRLGGGGFLDPNQLAAVLVAGAALSVGVVALFRGLPLVRFAALVTGAFAVTALCLTASRGGLIALSVALIAAIVVAGRWRLQVTLGAVLLALLTYGYFAQFASYETQLRIASPTEGQARIEEGRTTIWQVAERAFEANPAHGVGAGNFQHAARHYLLEPGTLLRTDEIIGEKPKVVHNTYLEIATELGLVGLLLFAVVVGFSLSAMVMASRIFRRLGDRPLEAASICAAVALMGALAAIFFISEQYSKQLWLLIGLGPAVLAMARAGRAGPS